MNRSMLFWILLLAVSFSLVIETGSGRKKKADQQDDAVTAQKSVEAEFEQTRNAMVDRQLIPRGIADQRVLLAMRNTPRHLFVASGYERYAYEDTPLPIGFGQTISQPYIVALMTELADPVPSDTVLEIGTGSGYQAAVISSLVEYVYSIEIVPGLAMRSNQTLHQAGYRNIEVRLGDGYAGWPEQAPFDIILVTAAPETIPRELVAQLAAGGRMIVPVGPVYGDQKLVLIRKATDGTISKRSIIPVRFVPMVKDSH